VRARRYAIIGTGGVGGFYGGRLARGGCDVHFLVHSDFDHVRRHGLRVDSPDGDFVLPRVQAYADAAGLPPCDVVVLALKTTQNHLLPLLLPPALAPEGVVLVLQNGFGIEEEVAGLVGPDRAMGGLCFLCSSKVGPGHIQHLDYGFVTLAEFSGDGRPRGVTGRMRAIASDLGAAGIEVRLAEDLLRARWEKLVWNIPFSGLSVVLDATSDELMADLRTRHLVEALMREVAAAAGACGRTIGDEFIQHMLDLTLKMKPYRTSMKIDCGRKRPMEVEAIFGNALRAARNAGAGCPRIEMLYELLKFMDARNLEAGGTRGT
jgi:2-dehydropantoate 2-reductase